MGSLRARLGIGLSASLLLVFAAQWLLVGLAIERVTENYVASRLEHEIEDLLAALEGGSGMLRIDPARIDPFYDRAFSGHYFRIAWRGEPLRSRSLWDTDLAVPGVAAGERRRLLLSGPQDQPLLVLVEGFRKQGLALNIAVAEDLSAIHDDIARFQRHYALLSGAALLVLLALAGVVVRRGLAPLEQARAGVVGLQHGELTRLDEDVPREVQPLVAEINRLLTLTQRRLARSRTATGNLAHALKTPLSSLARLGRDPALAHLPALRGQIERQVQGMTQLTERELKRARLSGAGTPGARFDPARELPDLIEALRRIHAERNLTIEMALPGQVGFRGDREDMLELFGNLLDNACKWARSRVLLTLEPGPGLHFRVEDDGPGVADAGLNELTRRGTRLDESRAGHGLGLAIVHDIVTQYEGTLAFGRAPALGGLRVEVMLPG